MGKRKGEPFGSPYSFCGFFEDPARQAGTNFVSSGLFEARKLCSRFSHFPVVTSIG
jgi:hypothetical protein